MVAEYQTNVDIANRTCQHLGARRIVAFTDNSVQASELGFVYDKVRQAELRRNNWRFAIKRVALRPIDTTTLFISFNVWNATVSYLPGQVVADPSGNGILWVNTTPFNINNAPGVSPLWDVYFGPLTADTYNSTNNSGYWTGEMVFENTSPGVANVYTSLLDQNTTDPSSITQWLSTTVYAKGQIVQNPADGFYYISLFDQNTNNTPGTYLAWDAGDTYAQNTIVGATDGNLYLSNANGNIGHNPVTDGGVNWSQTGGLWPWTSNFNNGVSANGWVYQFCTVSTPNIVYPLGAGPASQTFTKNMFRLPNGFLRQAPNDPKAGSVSFLGAPSGEMYKDWLFEGNYICSLEAQPIILRFTADMTFVPNFDPMFCEGLAARMAMETCERITQSMDKLKAVASAYANFMGQARTVNGIEEGATEPPVDDWISCRI